MSHTTLSQNVLYASVSGGVDNAEQRRAHAVAAALEVITARAPAMSSSGQLEHEMRKLSDYADLIQEALSAR